MADTLVFNPNNQQQQPGGQPAKPVGQVAKMKGKMGGKKVWITIIILLVLGAAGVMGWLYWDAKQDVDRLSNPQEAAQAEAKELAAAVSKLVEVPADEVPTVATVVDPAKLQNQAFFKNAQANDKVLIYTSARRAILYRPSTGKVIEIAPINIGDSSQSQSSDQGSADQGTGTE